MRNISVYLSAVCVLGSLALSGCGNFMYDRTQEITINTNPSGAMCTLTRNDTQIGIIAQTPGKVLVRNTADNIIVRCYKSGFRETVYVNEARSGLATFGNRRIGGVVGRELGASTWPDNKYREYMSFNLVSGW